MAERSHNYLKALVRVPKLGEKNEGLFNWIQVGVAFPGFPDSKYNCKLILNSMPIGHRGPLEIFLFPPDEAAAVSEPKPKSWSHKAPGDPPDPPDDLPDPDGVPF